MAARKLMPVLLMLSGCAAAGGARFSPDIAASFAHQPMRHMQTRSLDLYYPARARGEALRIAARLEGCVEALRELPLSRTQRPRLLVYLTSANFNNAFVDPMALGSPLQMVLPEHETSELFDLTIDPGGEIGDIACHEAVHYVQFQQVQALWKLIDEIGGDVLSPNVFTESWFLEGLAVHYEGRLGKDVGRPFNPIWQNLFISGAAAHRGPLDPGFLQLDHGEAAPFGGNYLVGEPFVDYLAATYGEHKLWQVVNLQAYNPVPALGVSLEFKRVYGKSLGALFDGFALQMSKRPLRLRPRDQRVLKPDLGEFARLAAAPDGSLAVIDAPRDRPAELVVLGPDDVERYRAPLAPILPERPFIVSSPDSVSGLCFSRDSRRLYFVVADVGENGDDDNTLVEMEVATGAVLRTWTHLQGMGGQLAPDGKRYVFTHYENDVANLYALDLASGRRTPLTHAASHQSLGVAAISPSGKRIAFPRWMGLGFDLFVLEDGTERQVTHDQRFNQSVRFIDEDHVVLLRQVDGRAQAFVLDLGTGAMAQATDAPYVAMDPAPRPGGRLAFVNRDGWHWSLDEVPLPTLLSPEPEPVPVPVPVIPPAVVEKDEPYHALDHLLIPTFRLPTVLYDPASPEAVTAGVEVAGSDRLGLHNYLVAALMSFPARATELGLSYANLQLAPWQLGISAGRSDDGAGTVDYTVDVAASRTFWTTPLEFELPIIHRDAPSLRDTLVGPRISTSYAALDGSVYGGTERGFSLSLAAQVFPQALGNDFDFADLRGALRVYLPQPFPRASLSVLAVGRALPGAPDDLLGVGGISEGNLTLESQPQTSDGLAQAILPTGVAFSEPLRGYEDHELHGSSVAIFGADFHVPVMIQRGWASTLYLFPSLFVRELDFDAFAREARLGGEAVTFHRAAGATATLSLRFGQVLAVNLFYQFAVRFDDGLGPLHLVGVSF